MSELSVRQRTLEITPPAAECGHCHFSSALRGTWSVEDGRLVWRAADDPQPGRGPDLNSCCESRPVVKFEWVTVTDSSPRWEYRILTEGELDALRVTAGLAI